MMGHGTPERLKAHLLKLIPNRRKQVRTTFAESVLLHEFSMAERIVKTVLDVANSRKASKVIQIDLDVGELTFLGYEQLKFGIEVLSKGTISEGVKVAIRKKKAKIRCSKCGYSGHVKYVGEEIHSMIPIPIIACPKCGSTDAAVTEGNECTVRSIRVRAAA
jgi:hydrogenase nickel incorporation protein HypA/HybF